MGLSCQVNAGKQALIEDFVPYSRLHDVCKPIRNSVTWVRELMLLPLQISVGRVKHF